MMVPLFTSYIAKDKNEIPQPRFSFLGKAVLIADSSLFRYFESSTNTLLEQKRKMRKRLEN